MAHGERRVDSPVSRRVVKNFYKGKFFENFWKWGLKHVLDNFPHFGYLGLSDPPDMSRHVWAGGVSIGKIAKVCFRQFPTLVYLHHSDPPYREMAKFHSVGRPRQNPFWTISQRLYISDSILPPCRRSCRALWQPESYKRGKMQH